MKNKLLTMLAIFCVGISSCYDDSDLRTQLADHEDRIQTLETICAQMNTNISSLQSIINALQQNDYITNIAPIMEGTKEIGYTITFSKSGPITIYHGENGLDGKDGKDGVDGENGADGKDGADGNDGVDGQDGLSPVIGVKMDEDGKYYWTLNGEWLLDDNGEKIPTAGADGKDGADGENGKDGVDGKDGQDAVTPQLKIVDNYWYVSYDNGESWTKLGRSLGEDTDSFFKSLTMEDGKVVFVLSDDTVIEVPYGRKAVLTFDIENNEVPISLGETVVINYILENATSDTQVTVASDGHYKATVKPNGISKGQIIVECPIPYVDGYVNVLVSDGNGYATVKVINFYEKYMSLSNGYEYSINALGGEINIPFWINFDYVLKVDSSSSSWLSVVETDTKAETRKENVTLFVEKNNETSARNGYVNVCAANNPSKVFCQIIVNQASSVFEVSTSSFVVDAEGKTLETTVTSSRGFYVNEEELPEWLTISYEVGEDEQTYKVLLTVSANTAEDKRNTAVALYADDQSSKLGELSLIQLGNQSGDSKDMIIRVRANFANDFTVSVPVHVDSWEHSENEVDVYIDWGDGVIDHYYREKGNYYDEIKITPHKYEGLSEGKNFDVRISGKLPSLSSYHMTALEKTSITEIVQWGNLGLKELSYGSYDSWGAFTDCVNLTSVAADNLFAFAEVTNFYAAFKGCTALENIPADLFKYATKATDFNNIFNGCTKLNELPEGLFSNCSSATSFNCAFANCTSLISTPDRLFENCSDVTNFNGVFSKCTALESVSGTTFKGCSSVTSFSNAFDFTAIQTLPGSLFEDCANVESFAYTFAQCKNLKTLPEELFASCSKVTNFDATFMICENLTAIPENLFANCPEVISFGSNTSPYEWSDEYFCGTFTKCHMLTSVPEKLFANNTKVQMFNKTFFNCIRLMNVPAGIFDNNVRVTGFYKTFDSCWEYSGESPYTEVNGEKVHLYERVNYPDNFVTPTAFAGCFENCSNLVDYADIPNDWIVHE